MGENMDSLGGKLPPVPTGLQTLLRLASLDVEFRRALIARRGQVAGAAGVKLTDREAAVLLAVTDGQLGAMVDSLPVPESARRDFFRQAGASAAVLLSGLGLGATTGSCESQSKGHRPDMPPPKASPSNESMEEGRDAGLARPDERPSPPAGIRPEVPPPRPEHPDMATKGGAEPSMPQ
jgi:hypothetical protein